MVRRPSRTRERRQEALAGYAFIAVPMALFLVLNIGALLYAAYISLWRWEILGPTEMIGLRNYAFTLRDPIFLRAIQNTFYYAVIVVPVQMILALTLAVVLNQNAHGRRFFPAAFFFPALAS